jgi:hypothetical protein
MNFYLSESWLAETKKQLLATKDFSVRSLATSEAAILVISDISLVPDPCDEKIMGCMTCFVDDGEKRVRVLIHERNIVRFDDTDEQRSRMQFGNGSVVLLTAYSHRIFNEETRMVLTPSQASSDAVPLDEETDKTTFMLVLERFRCIGHVDIPRLQAARPTIQASHTLVHLRSSMFNCTWSVKCLLVKKTAVKDFKIKGSGVDSKVQRIQWRDPSGTLEMTIFGGHCDLPHIRELKENSVYLVENAKIKPVAVSTRAWPDEFTLTVDLQYVDKTKLTELSDEAAEDYLTTPEPELVASQPVQKRKRDDSPHEAQTAPFVVANGLRLLSLMNLKFRAVGTKHNLLVVLLDFDEQVTKTTPSSRAADKDPLSLRRLRVADDSRCDPVKVTLWGYQADTFNRHTKYKRGTIILFKDVELSNYGGISLSVRRDSSFEKICEASEPVADDTFALEKIKALKKWWQDNKYDI